MGSWMASTMPERATGGVSTEPCRQLDVAAGPGVLPLAQRDHLVEREQIAAALAADAAQSRALSIEWLLADRALDLGRVRTLVGSRPALGHDAGPRLQGGSRRFRCGDRRSRRLPLGATLCSVVHQKGSPDRKSTRLNSSHLGISYAVF